MALSGHQKQTDRCPLLGVKRTSRFDRGVLHALRSDLAKRHLADHDLSISKVAWLLGYSDVSAFSSAYKRQTGKTPRAIRQQIAR
jgi:AraC-like DNA-binding protein